MLLGLNEAEAGEIVTELTAEADDPVAPRRATTKGRCCASVSRERIPSTVPGLVAPNFTVKLLLCPGESATGSVRPVRLKPAPLTVAWLTPRLLVPTFVTVATCEPVLPTFVLIETLLGDMESEGSGSAKPAHPEIEPTTRANVRTIGTNTCDWRRVIPSTVSLRLRVMVFRGDAGFFARFPVGSTG